MFAFAFVFKYVLCVLFCLSHICHLFGCFSIIFVRVAHSPHSFVHFLVAFFLIYLFCQIPYFCMLTQAKKLKIRNMEQNDDDRKRKSNIVCEQ